jgi:DNA-binding response OmpR family regulator
MQHESATHSSNVRPTLLWVDTDRATTTHCDVLASQFRVSRPGAPLTALDFLRRSIAAPDFVATEVTFAGGLGYEICRVAKALAVPSTVLVMTSVVELVPQAITAGCDAVLLKPFAPNLLLSRLARLKQLRFDSLRARTAIALAKSDHLLKRSDQGNAQMFEEWPSTSCPYCRHAGATCFEYSSRRRAWYACLACNKVWLAARRD